MRKKLMVLLGVALLTTVVIEFGFRLLESRLGVDKKQLESMRAYVCEGRVGIYVPHPYTVFAKPKNSFGFRPVAVETTDGGTENALGRTVPNMAGGFRAGSAILSWDGNPNDLTGRVFEINGSLGLAYGWLMPSGVGAAL